MKVVILSGGNGSRISEETRSKPKALIKIGDKPIIWHIMNHFAKYDFTEFIIALGYKGKMIEDELPEYCNGEYNVKYINTGVQTENGGRLKRLESLIGKESFILAWCDGLSNINVNKLVKFHKKNENIATLMAVNPPSKYGCLDIEKNAVIRFQEKPINRDIWINGGVFVLDSDIFNYIKDDNTNFEIDVLQLLAEERKLNAFKHDSFWQCMDTIKEMRSLNKIWLDGQAKW